MPKSSNQKLKIWYLFKILNEKTDEHHPISMSEIISELEKYGINAERKSIYNDIELLINAGVDIISEKRDRFVYYIGDRDFQLAELKLLIDFVQSSKFITAKKTGELIKKIEGLTSKNYAHELHSQVYINDRVKTSNEKIYYNINYLYTAINSGVRITFRYYKYNVLNNSKYKNNGNLYQVSPYGLVYSDDNYYLLAHYPKYEGITHFRVDKMTDITISSEKSIEIEKIAGKNFNFAEYVKKMFNMFRGETNTVTLNCKEEILNVVIDKFGENVFLRKGDNDRFFVTVKADISPAFFGWIFMLGETIEIVSPTDVRCSYNEHLRNIIKLYE
ncbi:MAG: WYL domain-containing protein [Clostridia bacterium]|nr:WYL domain-containing protein [Clostridia bacterium]